MVDQIVNTTMVSAVMVTQAQVVTAAVIGSILLTLVVLNFVMYAIFRKLTQAPKLSVKISKQEGVKLYQVRSTMEFNTLSSSSLNQSNSRSIRTASLWGEDTTSVQYSTGGRTPSYNRNRGFGSITTHEADQGDISGRVSRDMGQTSRNTSQNTSWRTSRNPSINTSRNTSTNISRNTSINISRNTSINTPKDSSRDKSINSSRDTYVSHKATSTLPQFKAECAQFNSTNLGSPPEATAAVETEAQVHENHSPGTRQVHGLSDIHLYQCLRSQMIDKKLHRDNKPQNTKGHLQKVKGYVNISDFDNESDTEASVLAVLDTVNMCLGAAQLLASPVGGLGRPVVEFQNKAFEFSETKTALEEVADTDL